MTLKTFLEHVQLTHFLNLCAILESSLNLRLLRSSHTFSAGNFIVSFLLCWFLLHIKLLFIGYVRQRLRYFPMVWFLFFTSGHPIFPVLSVAKIILSQLNCLGTSIEDQLTYRWRSISGLLIMFHRSVFMPEPHCPYDYTF